MTLDSDTVALIQRRMRERGISFKQALNDAIRTGAGEDRGEPFRTATAPLGVPVVNLDRALQLAAELEDEELVRWGEVVTYDSDFGRFPGVTWSTPGALEIPRQEDRPR